MIRKIALMLLLVLLAAPPAGAQKYGKKRGASERREHAASATDFSTLGQMLPLYTEAKAAGRDASAPLTSIYVFYGGLGAADKARCCSYLLRRADDLYAAGKCAEALAVADIYESLAPSGAPGRMKTAFFRGEQAALTASDTLALKRCMAAIEDFSADGAGERGQYLAVLGDYLTQIRQYVPVDRTMDGIWVSDLRDVDTGVPFFILSVAAQGDSVMFLLNNNSAYLDYAYKKYTPHVSAQEECAFAADSVYALWCSERVSEPSPELNYLVRQTGESISSFMGTKAAMNGGALSGSLTNSLVSIGTNLIADAIFTPTKRSYLLQAKMRKVNDNQIEIDMFSTMLKVRGSNEPEITQNEWQGLFTRVCDEDSLYWYNRYGIPLFTESLSGKEWLKLYRKYRYPKKQYHIKYIRIFNMMQIYKTMYRREKQCLERGESLSGLVRLHGTGLRPVAGLKFRPDAEGAVVETVAGGYPAYWAGLKKKDIITHVDGFAINSAEQFTSIVSRREPFDTISVRVKRGKKVFDREIMLYFVSE